MNNELYGMWKEAVATKSKVLSRYLPGGTDKYCENYSQVNWILRRDLNQRPYEYEARELITSARKQYQLMTSKEMATVWLRVARAEECAKKQ
jgi:hypothetical protein